MMKEFKDFAFGGNLVEIAVGLVMAIAFGVLVASLVENVLMPIVAAIFGEPDFSSLTFEIGDGVISYGSFINALITFIFVALAVFFFVVKPYNAYKARQAEEPEPEPSEEVQLLREIRDGLKSRN
jgi:large conductance mechanosensitive channel